MRFRPCIDIHNGAVKQIVGGTLTDQKDQAEENYISAYRAGHFAKMYQKDGLYGGHVIMLNPPSSEFYEETRQQAFEALRSFPGGLQIGGGINAENAKEYLEAGASHVIVTSYVFRDGKLEMDHLKKLVRAVGKEKIVLDLSCRKRGEEYLIVTDRWQKYTEIALTEEVLSDLSGFCNEYLVHGVDSEGKAKGIEKDLVRLLAKMNDFPITYAGGIGTLKELERFQEIGQNRLDFTIGSALDLFGGSIPYVKMVEGSQKGWKFT